MCKIIYPRWSRDLKKGMSQTIPQITSQSCPKRYKNYHESLMEIFAASDPFMSSIFSHLSARSLSTSSILKRMRFENAWPQIHASPSGVIHCSGISIINHPSSMHPSIHSGATYRTHHNHLLPSHRPSKGSNTSGTQQLSIHTCLPSFCRVLLKSFKRACHHIRCHDHRFITWHSEATHLEGIHQVLPMCGLIQGIPDGLKTQCQEAADSVAR